MLRGAFSNARHIGDTLEYAMVLCICALACIVGAKAGIFNVGGEGQLLLGAIAGGLFGVGAGCCLLLLHLGDLDSFGVNYTAPLSDGRPLGLLRLLLRPPKPWDNFRDPLLRTQDRRRQR